MRQYYGNIAEKSKEVKLTIDLKNNQDKINIEYIPPSAANTAKITASENTGSKKIELTNEGIPVDTQLR
jgi:hypothetical protein